jgi:integrase
MNGAGPAPRYDSSLARPGVSEGRRAHRASQQWDAHGSPPGQGPTLGRPLPRSPSPSGPGTGWSERHRDDQTSYCARFVLPVIADVALKDLRPWHFQRILDDAPTASVGAHLRTCLSAMVSAGLEEGLLLARQDVLRGVRWYRSAGPGIVTEDTGKYVDEADIPTAACVHALARAAASHTGVWWRELEILLVAYSGLRWGEHAALTADRVHTAGRRILVDRQVVETKHRLTLAPPKNRRRRTTMYPATTPLGLDLSAMVSRRLREVRHDGLLFPSPRGQWARRSNYRRNVFAGAALAAGWPIRPDGRLEWTFHSLRHVFATWALSQPGARIEDVSRLMGHSSVRITQDIYVSPDGDLFERFFELTR